jgi:hypothetical protein
MHALLVEDWEGVCVSPLSMATSTVNTQPGYRALMNNNGLRRV